MKKRGLISFLIILFCSVFSIACKVADSENRNVEVKNAADAITATARQANVIFNAQRAFTILEKQCEFGPRPPGSKAHTETQNYLFKELQKYADNVVLQPHTYKAETETLHLNNILAEFGPGAPPVTGNGQNGETILLAAHWDTRPFADHDPKPENQDKPILGANDGASGVAVLLEIARVLKEQPPPRRVVIALFDGEDYGRSIKDMFIGSRFFCPEPRKMETRLRNPVRHGRRQRFGITNRTIFLGGEPCLY